ncbi:hypothetical protein NBRC116492_06220 [Aurantivibrio infirmus]
MSKLTISVLFSLILINGFVQAQSLEASHKFKNESVQQRFIQELEKRSIPTRVDGEGRVLYPADKADEAHEIADSLLRWHNPPYSLQVTDEDLGKVFESKLVAHGIKYKKEEREEGYLYLWDAEDDVLAQKIMFESLVSNQQN